MARVGFCVSLVAGKGGFLCLIGLLLRVDITLAAASVSHWPPGKGRQNPCSCLCVLLASWQGWTKHLPRSLCLIGLLARVDKTFAAVAVSHWPPEKGGQRTVSEFYLELLCPNSSPENQT